MVQIRGVIEEDPVPDFLRYRGRWLGESSSPAPFWLLMTCWGTVAGVCVGLLALDAALTWCPLWLVEAGWSISCVGR